MTEQKKKDFRGFIAFCKALSREARSWVLAVAVGFASWQTVALLSGHPMGFAYWVNDSALAWLAFAAVRYWRGPIPMPGGWNDVARGLFEISVGGVRLAFRVLGNFALLLTICVMAVMLYWAWSDWEGMRHVLATATQDDIRRAMRLGFVVVALSTVGAMVLSRLLGQFTGLANDIESAFASAATQDENTEQDHGKIALAGRAVVWANRRDWQEITWIIMRLTIAMMIFAFLYTGARWLWAQF